MTLNDLRKEYVMGNLDKQSYLKKLSELLRILEDVRDFMIDTDIESLKVTKSNIICDFKSIPIKLFFDTKDISSPITQAMSFQNMEGDYSKKLIEYLKTTQVFFDIGANVGYYSLICSKFNTEAQIFSFEPMSSTYMKLIHNIALNACSNISPYNLGFSNEDSISRMYFNEAESGACSLRDIRGIGEPKEIAKFIKLDDFIEEHCIMPDLLKIDVEGAELFVLQGGERLLKERSPVIFIEILRKWCKAFNHLAADVFCFLHKLNYQGHIVKDGTLCPINNMTEETKETNFVFIKQR